MKGVKKDKMTRKMRLFLGFYGISCSFRGMTYNLHIHFKSLDIYKKNNLTFNTLIRIDTYKGSRKNSAFTCGPTT